MLRINVTGDRIAFPVYSAFVILALSGTVLSLICLPLTGSC